MFNYYLISGYQTGKPASEYSASLAGQTTAITCSRLAEDTVSCLYSNGAKMPGSTLPSVEDNVFYVADSITIDAPIEKVWNALLDFASYPAWFVPVGYHIQACCDA